MADELAAASARLLDDGLLTEASYVFALGREYFPGSAAIESGRRRLARLRPHDLGAQSRARTEAIEQHHHEDRCQQAEKCRQ